MVRSKDLRLVPSLGSSRGGRAGCNSGGVPELIRPYAGLPLRSARSFRAWLKTVTHNAWQDYLTRQNKPGRATGTESAFERLAAIEARDDLTRRLSEAFDEELLKEAAARVQLRVEPRTWDAFRLLAIEGRSGADVAERLDMKVATVYVARSKLQRMLREEVMRLDPDE